MAQEALAQRLADFARAGTKRKLAPEEEPRLAALVAEAPRDMAAVVAAVRSAAAPEASAAWCQAYEAISTYGARLPEIAGESFCSLHIGAEAPASVFALNHFLSSRREQGQRSRTKWCWRAAANNPHFEGQCWQRECSDAEAALHCHFADHFFPAADGSGALLSSPAWQVERLWAWVLKGGARPRPLPHAVFALPADGVAEGGVPQQSPEAMAVAAAIAAIGALRLGGALVLRSPRAAAPALAVFLALLFDDVEAAQPELRAAEAVVLVGLGFRGARSALLQAVVGAMRKVLAGRQALEPLLQCFAGAGRAAAAAGADEPWMAELPRWLACRMATRAAETSADAYLLRWGLRAIPEERHLMWGCWPEFLRGAGGGGAPPVEVEDVAPAEALKLRETRRRQWLETERRQQQQEEEEQQQRQQGEAPSFTGESPSSGSRAPPPAAEEPCGGAVRWFSLDGANAVHRSLQRFLQSKAARSGTWWQQCDALPPWRFGASPFAPPGKLRRAIAARSRAVSPPPCLGGGGGADAGAPPRLVADVVRVLAGCLRDRLGAGGRPLGYQRVVCLAVGDAGDAAAAAAWLSDRMSLPSAAVCMAADGALEERCREHAAQLPGGGCDAVVAQLPAGGHAAQWREVAASELDPARQRGAAAAALAALLLLRVGGDLLLRLGSTYSRHTAGLIALVAAAFDRVALVLPEDAAPAAGAAACEGAGDRWLVATGFAFREHRRTAVEPLQEVLRRILERLSALPAGASIPQLVPAACVCTKASGVRDLLRESNDRALDLELRGGFARGPPSSAAILAQLTRARLKVYVFPGAAYRKKVGLYFGSFDPIHENHFRVALCALRSCGVDRVLFVPNLGGNPYKPRCSPVEHRLRLLEERIRQAELAKDITAGEMMVCAVSVATNWPQRERLARDLELEEFAETPFTAEAAILLGEDSFAKSLTLAKAHKNSGIYQLKTTGRRIIVFPRDGDTSAVAAIVPERLRESVAVAAYRDLVPGLSSSTLRAVLKDQRATLPPQEVHPAVWAMFRGLCAQEAGEMPELAGPHLHNGSRASGGGSDDEGGEAGGDAAHDPRFHYDTLAPQSLEQRCGSATVRLRNFNSFAKAVLIEHCLSELRTRTGCEGRPLAVLDLGCGKGGDLKKFANCQVTHFCGVDISFGALEELVRRVAGIVADAKRAKHGPLGEAGLPLREISVLHADAWRDDLPAALDRRARHGVARLGPRHEAWFHVASSQMACHYAFESEASAERMLRNAAGRLCEGGVLVATLPDAQRILAAQRAARARGGVAPRIGNELFEIAFEEEEWEKVERHAASWRPGAGPGGPEVFGVRYRYFLQDAVDQCYEPLVHLETLCHLARRHGLVPHLGPRPLAELTEQAHSDRDLGRLRRIYFYGGGMSCGETSREREALRFYMAVAFRKVAPEGSGAMSCGALCEALEALSAAEQGAARLPRGGPDIVRLQP